MKKLAALTLSLFFVYGTALADTPKADTPKDADPAKSSPATNATKKDDKKTDKSDSAIEVEIEELRQAIQAQQEQLQMLKEELAKRDRQIDAAREEAAAANAHAAEATSKAVEAVNTTTEVKSTTDAMSNTVSDLKASTEVLKTTVASTTATNSTTAANSGGQGGTEEGPASIRYKGITITPGGFIAAETVWRQKATSSDINTNLNGTPFSGNGLAKVSEFNASGRQSRITLLGEGKIADAKVSGYYEADFLGAGATSNNRESNSYVLRQRQVFGQVAFDSGWSFTGGQMWSLVTETRTGLQNRTEATPMTIDAQYTIGFSWARQYGFRVVKSFNNKFALGVSVEGPQTTFSAHNIPTQFFLNQATPSGGGLLNSTDTTGSTFNLTPDFVVKAAMDPGFGHFEVFGIVRAFRDRVFPCTNLSLATLPAGCGAQNATASAGQAFGAFNDSRVGGGGGVNIRIPLFAKKLDVGMHSLIGDGVGRYGSGQLPDVSARPDGTLAPIRGGQLLGTLELHPTKKLDIYMNAGLEYDARTAYQVTTGANKAVGYGSPFFNNSGCNTETIGTSATPTGNTPSASGSCNGDVRSFVEGTIGFWHKIYQGPKGGVRWGLQYSYLVKNAWSGNNTVGTPNPALPGVSPAGENNMFFTSFRYYIP